MLLNKNNLASINIGMNAAFATALQAYPDRDLYKKLTFATKATTKTQEFGWLASMPSIREWVGDRHIGNIGKYTMQVANKKFEATVALSRDEIEDDEWARALPMATAFGEEVGRHQNEMVFSLLGAGFTTLAYDGQPFFDANHPVTNKAGNTQLFSNTQSGSNAPWYLLDLSSTVLRPIVYQDRRTFALTPMTDLTDEAVFTRDEFRWGIDGRCGAGLALWQKAFGSKADLNAANFDAAKLAMGTLIRDGGGSAAVRPTTLVCGPSNEAAAKQLLEAQLTAASGVSVSNTNFGAVELIVTPYLP